jgi:hypothetical protein
MNKDKYNEQLKLSAIDSVKNILSQSRLTEFVTINKLPEDSGNIYSYGQIKFGCTKTNRWNLNGINVYVREGNGKKRDRSNPRQIQFNLTSESTLENTRGCKLAFMEEICDSTNKASITNKKIHGVFCLESDAIEVANCIAEIMSKGDKRFFADDYTSHDDVIDTPSLSSSDKDYDPSLRDVLDQKTLTAIKTRRGQPKFRKALLAKYESTCQITGSRVEYILEAAHIYPHEKETNYQTSNGFLLRADIHTLFDLHLISIDEETRVMVDASLLGTEYELYNGKILMTSVPEEMQSNLKKRLELINLP